MARQYNGWTDPESGKTVILCVTAERPFPCRHPFIPPAPPLVTPRTSFAPPGGREGA
jgi:hypothetical protein